MLGLGTRLELGLPVAAGPAARLELLGALPAEHPCETHSHAIPEARRVVSDQKVALGAATTVIGGAFVFVKCVR
jgi:hypothetical protein